MNKDKMRSYNEKMRSQMDSGDYRSAQRTANNAFAELIGDGFNAIGGFFRNRREAKERERERQEELRRQREAAERRAKKRKVCIILVLIIGIGIGGFILVNRIFFNKATSEMETSTSVIISEEVFRETEQKNQETGSEMILNEDIQKENDGFLKKAGHFFSGIGSAIKGFFIMVWGYIVKYFNICIGWVKGMLKKL